MKKVQFRARAIQDIETNTDAIAKGDWVFGFYYFCRRRMRGIIVTTLGVESGGVGSGVVQVEVEVDYRTVSEFIGLTDKKKQGIYCGDILEERTEDGLRRFKVEWEEFNCCFSFVPLFKSGIKNWNTGSIWTELQVVGNVHDTPNF